MASLSSLSELSLEGLLTHHGLSMLGQVNPKLRKLSIRMSRSDLDPMDIFDVLTRLSNLQTLKISEANFQEEGRRPGSQRSRIPVIPSITRLNLRYYRDVPGLRLSPVRLSFTVGTCEPSFWETLLGNLPRLRALEVTLRSLRLANLEEVSLIQWTIAMVPARLHALSRLVAESVPSMELFAVGLAGRWPKPNWTHWTRIRLNGDNQRVAQDESIVKNERRLSFATSSSSRAYDVDRFHIALNRLGHVLRYGEASSATAT
ncbi:hypothetical protein POSPLADRAFT_1134551 [Postia placenta MAD-698-R-SB12]|uniref:F-box domain-containing protein n=1 Tax=Postia placenta MAD-698-R-SB12 TaxID=670580 RepID=A0A1X6N8E3_9APHY|nr:hypothetical protein POSPLADRAFT_1134551 [Postia placenta MAD-698-R-SB12]OSX64653.1 hypothetical protein POSPLADRAFT_1134551 [Postia placenta MAD-698-R-SB12]